jgi:hypothetical protein
MCMAFRILCDVHIGGPPVEMSEHQALTQWVAERGHACTRHPGRNPFAGPLTTLGWVTEHWARPAKLQVAPSILSYQVR